MIDHNLIAVTEAHPGDIIFWAARPLTGNPNPILPSVGGRGQVASAYTQNVPQVVIWFTGLVQGFDGLDTDHLTFPASEIIGVVRGYARV